MSNSDHSFVPTEPGESAHPAAFLEVIMQGPPNASADERVRRTATSPDPALARDGTRPATPPRAEASLRSASPSATQNSEAVPTAAPDQTHTRPPTRHVLTALAGLAVLAAVAFGGAYLIHSRNYVSTDNAQVDGDKVDITAPATGTLVNWRGEQGVQVSANEYIGRIKQGTSGAQPQMPIKSPGNGTIAVKDAVEGQWVTAGTELATAYDFDKIYITARVDEDDLTDVHLGAPVDVSVDAYPHARITGVVTDIQAGAAGVFSLFPQSNSTGNFQKVTQVVPVRITFTNTDGQYLVPGMNVTVHIHKQRQ
jgi:multidrug resistance efflux pump